MTSRGGLDASMLPSLDRQERDSLLDYGETVLRAAVTDEPLPKATPTLPAPLDRVLDARYGAFATLYTVGTLRGCIGTFAGSRTLREILPEVIRDAALADYRFDAVTPAELPGVSLSLSILTRARESSIDRIVLGMHGVIVEVGSKKAVFLPEVATEQRWDVETTLRMLERKADLPFGSARRPDAKILVFESLKVERRDEV